MAGCRKRRLNHAGSVCPLSLSLSLVFWVFCGVYWGHFLCCVNLRLYVYCLFCLVLFRLSVPLQVIDWEDPSPK